MFQRIKWMQFMIIISMLFMLALPAVYAEPIEETNTEELISLVVPLGRVNLTSGSYIELSQLNLLPSNAGNTVSFTLTAYNNGNTELSLLDYWVNIKSKSGIQYSTNILPADKDKNRVSPKSSETLSYYTTVGDSIQLPDLLFDIIRWDFSSPTFTRTLGQVGVSDAYTNMVPINHKRILSIGNNQMKVNLESMIVNPTDVSYQITASLYFDNIGNKSVVLPSYQYYLLTSEGFLYPLDSSGDQSAIHPRLTKTLQLRGVIPSSLESTGWQLVITVPDNASKINLPIVSFAISSLSLDEASNVTPYNTNKFISAGNTFIQSKVTRYNRNLTQTSYIGTINLNLENTGTNSIQLPAYTFAIRTQDGLVYPVSSDLGNSSIDPKVNKDIRLTVTIPSLVSPTNWRLLIYNPSDSNKESDKTILAIYELPNQTESNLTTNSTYHYSNIYGAYRIKLDTIQRLPWEDQDILTANLVITNTGLSPIPVPTITGYFLLDNIIKVPAKVIQKDNVIAVKGKSNLNMSVYGKIPYTYEYSSLKLVLQDKVSDQQLNDIVEFTSDANTNRILNIPLGKTYNIQGVGRASTIYANEVRTYKTSNSNILTLRLDIKNLEKRFTNLVDLVGYFRTSDQFMYPAKLTTINSKINPLGFGSVYVWTELPLGMDTFNMELILGEGVTDNKLSNGGSSDSYINAVAITLPIEAPESNNFKQINLHPYTLDITNIIGNIITTDSYQVSFDYELLRNSTSVLGNEKHKLVVEFLDKTGTMFFSESLELAQF